MRRAGATGAHVVNQLGWQLLLCNEIGRTSTTASSADALSACDLSVNRNGSHTCKYMPHEDFKTSLSIALLVLLLVIEIMTYASSACDVRDFFCMCLLRNRICQKNHDRTESKHVHLTLPHWPKEGSAPLLILSWRVGPTSPGLPDGFPLKAPGRTYEPWSKLLLRGPYRAPRKGY